MPLSYYLFTDRGSSALFTYLLLVELVSVELAAVLRYLAVDPVVRLSLERERNVFNQ